MDASELEEIGFKVLEHKAEAIDLDSVSREGLGVRKTPLSCATGQPSNIETIQLRHGLTDEQGEQLHRIAEQLFAEQLTTGAPSGGEFQLPESPPMWVWTEVNRWRDREAPAVPQQAVSDSFAQEWGKVYDRERRFVERWRIGEFGGDDRLSEACRFADFCVADFDKGDWTKMWKVHAGVEDRETAADFLIVTANCLRLTRWQIKVELLGSEQKDEIRAIRDAARALENAIHGASDGALETFKALSRVEAGGDEDLAFQGREDIEFIGQLGDLDWTATKALDLAEGDESAFGYAEGPLRRLKMPAHEGASEVYEEAARMLAHYFGVFAPQPQQKEHRSRYVAKALKSIGGPETKRSAQSYLSGNAEHSFCVKGCNLHDHRKKYAVWYEKVR